MGSNTTNHGKACEILWGMKSKLSRLHSSKHEQYLVRFLVQKHVINSLKKLPKRVE